MITRRSLFGWVPALALAACAQTGTSPTTGSPTVNPLDKIKTLAAATVAELPLMVQDLANTGALKDQQLADANIAVKAAQQVLPQIEALQPGVTPQTQIVQTLTVLLNSLQIILSFIPQTAPYAPMLAALVALVQAYVTNTPVSPTTVPPAAAQILRY